MITQRTLITHWKCFNIALFSNVKILCIVVKKNWCFCPFWNDRVDWTPKSILILTTSAELWQLIPIFISKRIDSNGKWRGLISMRTYSRNIRIRSIFISQGILKRTTGNGNMYEARTRALWSMWSATMPSFHCLDVTPELGRPYCESATRDACILRGNRGGSRAAIQVFELEPEQLRYAELTAGIDRWGIRLRRLLGPMRTYLTLELLRSWTHRSL